MSLMLTLAQREEAQKLWGFPQTKDDIGKLFATFCRGKLAALPWSDEAPAAETTVISEHLAKLNEVGFLTINSQPAVNGVLSTDKIHGWGPENGFVYQKVRHEISSEQLLIVFQAYLEFFVSPSLLAALIPQIERDPLITYYAINKRGDLRTNTQSEGPNAVTWGVFPGKEVVQPTIVEAVSFMAWKVKWLVVASFATNGDTGRGL